MKILVYLMVLVDNQGTKPQIITMPSEDNKLNMKGNPVQELPGQQ